MFLLPSTSRLTFFSFLQQCSIKLSLTGVTHTIYSHSNHITKCFMLENKHYRLNDYSRNYSIVSKKINVSSLPFPKDIVVCLELMRCRFSKLDRIGTRSTEAVFQAFGQFLNALLLSKVSHITITNIVKDERFSCFVNNVFIKSLRRFTCEQLLQTLAILTRCIPLEKTKPELFVAVISSTLEKIIIPRKPKTSIMWPTAMDKLTVKQYCSIAFYASHLLKLLDFKYQERFIKIYYCREFENNFLKDASLIDLQLIALSVGITNCAPLSTLGKCIVTRLTSMLGEVFQPPIQSPHITVHLPPLLLALAPLQACSEMTSVFVVAISRLSKLKLHPRDFVILFQAITTFTQSHEANKTELAPTVKEDLVPAVLIQNLASILDSVGAIFSPLDSNTLLQAILYLKISASLQSSAITQLFLNATHTNFTEYESIHLFTLLIQHVDTHVIWETISPFCNGIEEVKQLHNFISHSLERVSCTTCTCAVQNIAKMSFFSRIAIAFLNQESLANIHAVNLRPLEQQMEIS